MKKILKKLKLSLPIDSKGNAPDLARSAEDWDDWRTEMKKEHSFLFWLNNTLPTYRYPVTHRYQRWSEWVRYRLKRRCHIVNTGQAPGYMETGDRMFYANFNLLKEFVEGEKAWMNRWNDEGVTRSEIKKNGRKYGLKYLDWEISLNDNGTFEKNGYDGQSTSAQKIKDLYLWWVDERPLRIKSCLSQSTQRSQW